MENFYWIYAILSTLVIAFLFAHRKRAKVDKYEYLDVLSYTEWKSGRTICKELELRHGGWISYGELYVNLKHLEEEGLVEHRNEQEEFDDGHFKTIIKRRDFRKKPGGRKVGQ